MHRKKSKEIFRKTVNCGKSRLYISLGGDDEKDDLAKLD